MSSILSIFNFSNLTEFFIFFSSFFKISVILSIFSLVSSTFFIQFSTTSIFSLIESFVSNTFFLIESTEPFTQEIQELIVSKYFFMFGLSSLINSLNSLNVFFQSSTSFKALTFTEKLLQK